MDRNIAGAAFADFINVALLAEGVDRNLLEVSNATDVTVALLAEGVDRNNGKIVVFDEAT